MLKTLVDAYEFALNYKGVHLTRVPTKTWGSPLHRQQAEATTDHMRQFLDLACQEQMELPMRVSIAIGAVGRASIMLPCVPENLHRMPIQPAKG